MSVKKSLSGCRCEKQREREREREREWGLDSWSEKNKGLWATSLCRKSNCVQMD